RVNRAGRAARDIGRLADIGHNLVEGIRVGGNNGPEPEESGDTYGPKFSKRHAHGLHLPCLSLVSIIDFRSMTHLSSEILHPPGKLPRAACAKPLGGHVPGTHRSGGF